MITKTVSTWQIRLVTSAKVAKKLPERLVLPRQDWSRFVFTRGLQSVSPTPALINGAIPSCTACRAKNAWPHARVSMPAGPCYKLIVLKMACLGLVCKIGGGAEGS